MTTTEPIGHQKIGEIVAADFRTAAVFKKFGIDFCCGGGKTVGEVCQQKGLNINELELALHQLPAASSATPSLRFDHWELPFLIDYIVNEHHAYVQEKLPLIDQFAQKVGKVHGDHNPETVKISHLVQALKAELLDHLWKEEHILFPYIKTLAEASKNNAPRPVPAFQTAANPIRMMLREHETAGDLMHSIRELSTDYTPPDYACNTYRVLYAMLADFEENLHQHVHLENNILFPKALNMEQSASFN